MEEVSVSFNVAHEFSLQFALRERAATQQYDEF